MAEDVNAITFDLQMAMEAVDAGVQTLQDWLLQPGADKHELMDQIKDLTTREHLLNVHVAKGLILAHATGEQPVLNGPLIDQLLFDIHKLMTSRHMQQKLGVQQQRAMGFILRRIVESIKQGKKKFKVEKSTLEQLD